MGNPFFTATSRVRLSDVLVAEAELGLSRKSVTVLAGAGADRILKIGTVLGAILFADPVIAAAEGNTGNGAMGALTLGDGCKIGVYTVTCIAAAANGGRFQVVDPDGYRLADALVGVAWQSPQLGFTIADGAVDFAVGDVITITVARGSGKVVQLNPAAHDGTQLADSVLITHSIAPDGVDVPGQAVERDAVVTDKGLVWPAGISAPAKAAAIARLAKTRNYVVEAA